MSKSGSEHDLIELLNLAGADWMRNRVWRLQSISDGNENGSLPIQGPAFCYHWEQGGSEVRVNFLASGSARLAPTQSALLVIEVGAGTLRIRTPHNDPQIIGALSPAHYQQIIELISEAQNAQTHHASSWPRDMALIASSMRMTTLALEVASAAAAPERGGKRSPKKDQLVTQLHEWLRPNLEESVKLGDAAVRFEKSPRQLIRILKETTGAGFAEHLTMHRLTLARSLLMRSDQSVREVAKTAGFNSREQFIRSFSKAFSWTPLQFRKAWNRASLSESDLEALCQVSGRSSVSWTTPDESALTPQEGNEGAAHTVVVANALHEIVELFWVSPEGKQARIDVLEHGGMAFVNRDNGGSAWVVRAPGSGLERFFVTPDDHALAVVSRDLAS